MNNERILELADRIGRARHHRQDGPWPDSDSLTAFNMVAWHCGSVGCIGGWAMHMFHGENDAMDDGTDAVAQLLDITNEQANSLCYPDLPAGMRYDDVTPARAASVLRRFAETGEVEWQP